MSNLKSTGFSRSRPRDPGPGDHGPRTVDQRVLTVDPRALGIAVVAAVAISLSGCGSDSSQSASSQRTTTSESRGFDTGAVQGMWTSYRKALIERDARNASRMVSHESLLHYARLRDLALTVTRSELLSQTMLDRATILSMRVSLPVATLRSAADEEVFGLIVSHKLIDGDSIKDSTISGIQVSGDIARGNLVLKGERTGIAVTFKHEGGMWTVDLPALFTEMETTFLETSIGQETTEKEYAEYLAINRLGQDKSKIAEAYQPPEG